MSEPTSSAEQLNDLRRRYLAGEAWTRDELKTAIHTMIGNRLNAVRDAGATKTKTKAAPVSLDDLLSTVPKPEVPKQIGIDLASSPDKTVEVTKVQDKIVGVKELPAPTKPDTSGFF